MPRRVPQAVDPVRNAVAGVLLRVERDGAFADILLDRATGEMSARDAAFCTALTLGVLRRRAQLDWVLDRYLRKPVYGAAAPIRQILRLGAFQILHMEVRKAAAVDECVKLAKAHGTAYEAKLVNAVLRRVDRDAAFEQLLSLDVRRVRNWSPLTGAPEWYVRAVRAVWPGEQGAYICAAAVSEPPLTVRVNLARATTGHVQQAFRDAGIGSTVHPAVPDVLTMFCPAPVLISSPPFVQGWCHVQDGSAVLAALALDAQPGERVADLCAAPGGKAAVLAAAVRDAGAVVAVEKQPRRATMVRELAAREGFTQLQVVEGDATQPLPELPPDTFDRVLVDAPCSAFGIARHRPDMWWRHAPNVAAEMAPTQRALLAAGLRLLKPGGVLVYSVCTFTPAEGVGIVDAVLAGQTGWTRDPLPSLLDRWTQEPGHATIPPGDCGLDGFSIHRLRRMT